jgi:hypothetical protein
MSRRDYVITLRLKGKHHRNIEVQRAIKQAILAYANISLEGEPLYEVNTSSQVKVEVFKREVKDEG